jgi:hypothetical protein
MVIIKMFSKIKYVALAALMVTSLTVNADYTAKIFIEEISLKGLTPPPTPGVDGDTTEQTGGESGQLTYTVSRTSGYNHSQFNVEIKSNSYDCFSVTPPPAIGSSVEYCGVGYPYNNNLYIKYAPPGIHTFEVKALNEYGGVAVKSYSFNIEILPIADDKTSDGDLSFGFYKKIINQGEEFSVAINSSTFDCFEINIITNGAGNVESGCSVTYPYSASVYLNDYGLLDAGEVQLEISGYNLGDELNAKKYPFYVTVNEEPAGPVVPVLDDFVMQSGQPYVNNSFLSSYFGQSVVVDNYFAFYAGKSKEYKLDIPSIGYSTDWVTISNYSDDVTEYAVVNPVNSHFDTTTDVVFSLRNEAEVVSNTKQFELWSTSIDEVEFQLCLSNGSGCNMFPAQSMAIWAGGSGTSASVTFKGDNVDCMTISSINDPNYITPVRKCYYNGGQDVSALFYLEYPNHDPVNQTPKFYTYNFIAENEVQTLNYTYTVEIYYD